MMLPVRVLLFGGVGGGVEDLADFEGEGFGGEGFGQEGGIAVEDGFEEG